MNREDKAHVINMPNPPMPQTLRFYDEPRVKVVHTNRDDAAYSVSPDPKFIELLEEIAAEEAVSKQYIKNLSNFVSETSTAYRNTEANYKSRSLRKQSETIDALKSIARQMMHSRESQRHYDTCILKKLDIMQLYSANESLRNNKAIYDKLALIEDSLDAHTPWLVLIAICSAVTAIASVINAIN